MTTYVSQNEARGSDGRDACFPSPRAAARGCIPQDTPFKSEPILPESRGLFLLSLLGFVFF